MNTAAARTRNKEKEIILQRFFYLSKQRDLEYTFIINVLELRKRTAALAKLSSTTLARASAAATAVVALFQVLIVYVWWRRTIRVRTPAHLLFLQLRGVNLIPAALHAAAATAAATPAAAAAAAAATT